MEASLLAWETALHFTKGFQVRLVWPRLLTRSKCLTSISKKILHSGSITMYRFADGIDLNVQDPVAHKRIPSVVILVKMAHEWAKSHGGRLPSTREEKKEFKELLKAGMVAQDEDNYKEAIEVSFEVFTPRGSSSDLQQILNDSSAEVESSSSDFWVLVAALKVQPSAKRFK